jgi:hypothetical protein
MRQYDNNNVAYRPVAKQLLCEQRPLLGNARNIHARNMVMQLISKQRISKHAYNNRVIDGNGVFYSVRAQWL